jgi:hypothetical protein
MNMISTGTFLNGMDASNKQSELVKKLVAAWEKKNNKTARAGGVSLMALSLAACGSEDTTPFAQSDIDAAVAPLAAAAIVGEAALAAAQADAAGALVAQLAAETQAAEALVASAAAQADAAAATVAGATATAAAAAATVAQAAAEASLATAQAALTAANAEKATLQTSYDALVASNATLQASYDALVAPKSLAATAAATPDNLIGATGNDTFSAAAGTVAATDRFTDTSTTDSDTLTIVHATAPGAFTSTNIENIDITINNLGAVAVDAANITGTTSLTVTRGDVVVGGSTLTGNKAVSVTNVDSSQIGSITVGAGTTTVNVDSANTDTAGHVLNADVATGAITVDGAATINAALSTQVDIDAVSHAASAGLASTINAASAGTVTTHANLTGAVTINAAKATVVTVSDAQGGATVNAATANTADSTITVVDVDSSGATITVGTGADDTTTVANIGLDVTIDGTAATTDAATISGAGHIELSIAGTGAQGNVDLVTLSGNGAGVVYDLAAPTTGTAVSFTKAGTQSVEIMGDASEFSAITITDIDVIDVIAGGGAAFNAGLFSNVGKVDLGVAIGNFAITAVSGSTYEITADQTTKTDFDFSAAGGGDLTIIAGDDNGASAAVGTIALQAFNAAAAATTVGTVTLEASIANVTASATVLGAKQNLVITGDEDVTLGAVTADSVSAANSSGIINLTSAANVDVVATGSGADIIVINDGTTSAASGAAGVDTVSAGAGNDTITITDTGNTASIDAGAGDDTINVDDVNSNFVVVGGAGADNFTTNLALVSTLVGGDGSDTITIDQAGALTLGATFSFSGIEEFDITAANGQVDITGAQLANNSTLIIDGNAAADIFNVNTASTAALAKSADLSNVTVKTGGTATITVTGNVGADTITGGVASEGFTQTIGVDSYDGGAGLGVDTFTTVTNLSAAGTSNASTGTIVNMGGTAVSAASVVSNASAYISGSITEVGAGKIGHLYAANVAGNSGELDTIAGVENITGSGGIDYIVGNDSNNVIDGAAGVDWIDGGAGADTITGGTGADKISLGLSDAVADTVKMSHTNQAADTIYQFEEALDILHFADGANLQILGTSTEVFTKGTQAAAIAGATMAATDNVIVLTDAVTNNTAAGIQTAIAAIHAGASALGNGVIVVAAAAAGNAKVWYDAAIANTNSVELYELDGVVLADLATLTTANFVIA